MVPLVFRSSGVTPSCAHFFRFTSLDISSDQWPTTVRPHTLFRQLLYNQHPPHRQPDCHPNNGRIHLSSYRTSLQILRRIYNLSQKRTRVEQRFAEFHSLSLSPSLSWCELFSLTLPLTTSRSRLPPLSALPGHCADSRLISSPVSSFLFCPVVLGLLGRSVS